MIHLNKHHYRLEYKRFGSELVRVSGTLDELKRMGRQLTRLSHIGRVWIRCSATGCFA